MLSIITLSFLTLSRRAIFLKLACDQEKTGTVFKLEGRAEQKLVITN
jgi:hypothetical protein